MIWIKRAAILLDITKHLKNERQLKMEKQLKKSRR